jgi:hypothetical protein
VFAAQDCEKYPAREEAPAMTRNSYHRFIDRGLKAGLNSRELNQALATRPVAGEELPAGQADGNGYLSEIDSRGYQLYRQAGPDPRD